MKIIFLGIFTSIGCQLDLFFSYLKRKDDKRHIIFYLSWWSIDDWMNFIRYAYWNYIVCFNILMAKLISILAQQAQ